ncbi:hypothetical protein HanIR_Chr09g0411911 [Helianthus annuus]|nr:hypothetical protein HanIR_Chr09g0411911 [Helianthus annuus]
MINIHCCSTISKRYRFPKLIRIFKPPLQFSVRGSPFGETGRLLGLHIDLQISSVQRGLQPTSWKLQRRWCQMIHLVLPHWGSRWRHLRS